MKVTKIVRFLVLRGLLVCSLLTVASADEVPPKAVLVTGGSSGIGLQTAENLAANGYYVYAGARKAADLERLDAMENMRSVRLDVTVQEDIDKAVEFVTGEGRGLLGHR